MYDADGQLVQTPRAVLRQVLDDARATWPPAGVRPRAGVLRLPPGPGQQGYAPIYGPQSWFSVHALGLAQRFIDELDHAIAVMGLPVYEIFSEHGAGQFEINLEPGPGLLAADRVVALKIAIKQIAQTLGLRATFMASPTNLDITPPSGYHLHQSLLGPDGQNVLLDPAAAHGLSATARQYIAGQLAHAPAMTAIASPTVTAYKRYQVGNWAPVQIAWGIENRTALVRALPDGPDTRIENRLGSSDANPYLLAAVMVAAGLDGIRRSLEPPDPVSDNLFENLRYQRLPASPAEGLDGAGRGRGARSGTGPVFTSTFTDVLRFDWLRYLSHVSDWEISEYREML